MSDNNDEKEEFRLFKHTYKDPKTGEQKTRAAWYIEFRSHLRTRYRWPGFTSERQTRRLAEQIMDLIGARRTSERLTEKQTAFIENTTKELRERLIEAGIIDRPHSLRGGPLLAHLEGKKDDDGKIVTPGFQQALEAKGRTPDHIATTVKRIRRIFDKCSFATCDDLRRPGARTDVEVFLGGLREKKKINGASYNYYVRCLRSFCKWMVEDGRIQENPFSKLTKVTNTDIDKDERRELLIDEVRWLLDITLKGKKERSGLTHEERERLYRFAYESGLRPNQIRGLTKASFSLDGDLPTVTAKAETVKRRKPHTQVVTPKMAKELKKLFAAMMPATPAFRMPSKCQVARMFRRDLADARTAWIEAAGKDDQERVRRQQSDFLSPKSHAGASADFYSLRHTHGSALADAGVPQKDIQASLHHTTSRTTERYLHTRQHALAVAVGKLPEVKPAATGTD